MEKHIFRNHLNMEQTNVELLPNVLKHHFSDSEKLLPLPANQMCCLLLWEFPSFTRWTLSGVSKRELWCMKCTNVLRTREISSAFSGKRGFLQHCFPCKDGVFSSHTGCKHHCKLLLPVGWWYQDRSVLGSVPQPRGRLQNSNGLQHTDLDGRTAQPLRSEKFKPALDYLLQQVCAQSVLLALGMHETFIVVGSLGLEMKAEAPEQWMERKSCFNLKLLLTFLTKPPPSLPPGQLLPSTLTCQPDSEANSTPWSPTDHTVKAFGSDLNHRWAPASIRAK